MTDPIRRAHPDFVGNLVSLVADLALEGGYASLIRRAGVSLPA